MTWDRSKQNYWIFRGGIADACPILDSKTNIPISVKIPREKIYDKDLVKQICFAESAEKIKEILK